MANNRQKIKMRKYFSHLIVYSHKNKVSFFFLSDLWGVKRRVCLLIIALYDGSGREHATIEQVIFVKQNNLEKIDTDKMA